jgi:hypothetical protein
MFVIVIDFLKMIKTKETSKKQKLLNKTALSTMNLKKTDGGYELHPRQTNITYRPRYVQKQWKEDLCQTSSNKKSFFNKTQNPQALNRSFERVESRNF